MLQTEVERDGARRSGRVRRVTTPAPPDPSVVLRVGPMPGPWQRRAACRSLPPELFFPTVNSPECDEDTDRALAVCQGCEVRSLCLEFAIVTNQAGIWGGATEEQRRAIKRARRRRRAQAASKVS